MGSSSKRPVSPGGVLLRYRAAVAEDVLGEAFSLFARPVYTRAALLFRQVTKTVDRHKLEVVGHFQEVLYLLPLLGDLHGRGDELDAYVKSGGGEPDVFDGRPHSEDRVEARELAGTVLRPVQEDGQEQRRARDELAVVLAQSSRHAEAVHHGLACAGEDLASEGLEDARHLVEVDAVALLIHLFFGEAEVWAVALPEGALLQ